MRDHFDLGAALHESEPAPEPAKRWFQAVDFPWGCLPGDLPESIKQYGRAFASSPEPIPFFMLAHIAASVGRAVNVSPKRGWIEPLIIWFLEIASSGDGKTAKMRGLSGRLEELQGVETARAEQEKASYDGLPPKERRQSDPPQKARGYFNTGYTLEGLADELRGHPTGGLIVMLSEGSTLITSLGEYKGGRGSDREALLCLHDGLRARISRASGARDIAPGRVQFIGGVQPAVLSQVFSTGDDLLKKDGTLFRCLFFNSVGEFIPLTRESWSDEHRERWAAILHRALEFGDQNAEAPKTLCLSDTAWTLFQDWRNRLHLAAKKDMPGILAGFIPKGTGYALRLAGLLHLLDSFNHGRHPGLVIDHQRMESAIELVEFLLSQAESTIWTLNTGEASGPSVTLENEITAAILALENEINGGALPVSRITDTINAGRADGFKVDPRSVGRVIRNLGLTSKSDGSGRNIILTPEFLKRMKKTSETSVMSKNVVSQDFAALTLKKETSETSSHDPGPTDVSDITKRNVSSVNPYGSKAVDVSDITDVSFQGLDENGRGFI